MLKKRVIFSLIYEDGYFNLSRNFRLQKVGDLNWLLKNYHLEKTTFSIDELVIVDASRGERDLERFTNTIRTISEHCFVPVAAGGGISTVNEAKEHFLHGADKVVLNTAVYQNPELLVKIAEMYGRQSLVASVDAKRVDNEYRVFINNGKDMIEPRLQEWLFHLNELPIGEIYLNSIDKDGTGQGFDENLIKGNEKGMGIPIILAGGAGNAVHLEEAINYPSVEAVATANLFNFVGDGLSVARAKLIDNGIVLPQWDTKEAEKLKGVFLI